MNIVIKKIICGLVVLASVVSCLDGGSYTSSYPLNADFEYESLNFRPDSTYYYSADYLGIGWNYLLFCHKVDKDGDFLGGFRLSRLEGQIKNVDEEHRPLYEETLASLDMTWRVYTKPFKNTYMVFYKSNEMPDSDIIFMNPTNGTCTMSACLVCNTAGVAEEVKEKFERGDKLMLKATGYLGKKETSSAEIALADYTLTDKSGAQKDSIVSTWTVFDLSKLGLVDEVRFEMDSKGKDVSQYFCLDHLRANISLSY